MGNCRTVLESCGRRGKCRKNCRRTRADIGTKFLTKFDKMYCSRNKDVARLNIVVATRKIVMAAES